MKPVLANVEKILRRHHRTVTLDHLAEPAVDAGDYEYHLVSGKDGGRTECFAVRTEKDGNTVNGLFALNEISLTDEDRCGF